MSATFPAGGGVFRIVGEADSVLTSARGQVEGMPVTGPHTDRGHLSIVSPAAEATLDERALLQSILQYIREHVKLSRDLAHEMKRRRPARSAPGRKPQRSSRFA